MVTRRGHVRCWGVVALMLAVALARRADAYDPVDPTGNVTVVWDILRAKGNQYTVQVGIHNWQRLRAVANWSLTWTWPGKEFIEAARVRQALCFPSAPCLPALHDFRKAGKRCRAPHAGQWMSCRDAENQCSRAGRNTYASALSSRCTWKCRPLA